MLLLILICRFHRFCENIWSIVSQCRSSFKRISKCWLVLLLLCIPLFIFKNFLYLILVIDIWLIEVLLSLSAHFRIVTMLLHLHYLLERRCERSLIRRAVINTIVKSDGYTSTDRCLIQFIVLVIISIIICMVCVWVYIFFNMIFYKSLIIHLFFLWHKF